MRSTAADSTTHRPPFFVCSAAELAGKEVVLCGSEGRHAALARRLRPGEHAYLTDGGGTVARCVVTAARPDELTLTVLDRTAEPRPEPSLAVAQAILKGDRAELAVELLTEVGADLIVPWAATRCVARWRDDRAARALARWRNAALAAAKQSRRAWFPVVAPSAGLPGVTELVRTAALAVLLDTAGRARLADVPVPATGQVVLIVGPEGGLAPEEKDTLTAAGAVPARLGPTVLRASSAGAVAAGLMLSRTRRW